MTAFNQLTINGKSNADFPFDVYVRTSSGYNYPKKKNQLIETLYGTGAIRDENNAYPPIEKRYTIYCPTATLMDMRGITSWLSDSGTLIALEEPDVFYEILDVSVSDAPLHEVGGYQIDVTFITQPFGYEHQQRTRTYTGGETFYNLTNAPMYPRIEVYGTSASEQIITIGEQEVRLKELNEKITIESKSLEQNLYGRQGQELNSFMHGDFFEIPPHSTNKVTLSSGINRIEMLERWAWR